MKHLCKQFGYLYKTSTYFKYEIIKLLTADHRNPHAWMYLIPM